MIREVLEALKMDILDTINNFWETNDGGEYKSGLCGEFAVALGEFSYRRDLTLVLLQTCLAA